MITEQPHSLSASSARAFSDSAQSSAAASSFKSSPRASSARSTACCSAKDRLSISSCSCSERWMRSSKLRSSAIGSAAEKHCIAISRARVVWRDVVLQRGGERTARSMTAVYISRDSTPPLTSLAPPSPSLAPPPSLPIALPLASPPLPPSASPPSLSLSLADAASASPSALRVRASAP